MEISRYTFHDAYLIAELQHAYQNASAKGRIRLLQKLYRQSQQLPFEIAFLAVADSHTEVRWWIARHGQNLDYRNDNEKDQQGQESQNTALFDANGKPIVWEQPPTRNLWNCLGNDAEPFIRASLRENPTFFPLLPPWPGAREANINAFRALSHLERLAVLRNPEAGQAYHFIKHIFDDEDTELDLDIETRRELLSAFLSNDMALKCLSDEEKVQLYHKCDNLPGRVAILMSSWGRDMETLKLGMSDANAICRELACEKLAMGSLLARSIAVSLVSGNQDIPLSTGSIENAILDPILQGEDKASLRGFAKNVSISIPALENVRRRLKELDDEFGSQLAKRTIRQRQSELAWLRISRISQQEEEEDEGYSRADFAELFGSERAGITGGWSSFPKIDLAGKQLVAMDDEIRSLSNAVDELKTIVEEAERGDFPEKKFLSTENKLASLETRLRDFSTTMDDEIRSLSNAVDKLKTIVEEAGSIDSSENKLRSIENKLISLEKQLKDASMAIDKVSRSISWWVGFLILAILLGLIFK